MSILNRSWLLTEADERSATDISKEFSISKHTAQVLINRGLRKEDIGEFLNPRLSALKDPFEIPGIKAAVSRIMLAKDRGEHVFVYGDYDVDGVTATSIIIQGLRKLGLTASYYVPHRYDEGYGMNSEAVKTIVAGGAKLLITVDCGISNYEEINEANSLGLDVIVTDHHNIPERLPSACAVVNPKMMEADHPSRNLCGAGVAFKVIWALFREAGIKDSSAIKELLDLAALGTVADVVPMTGENRTIAVAGLKVLNDKKRVGVSSLVNSARITGDITNQKISFMLAPRLNAPGRLEHAELSIRLLLEDDPQKALALANEINVINTQRQKIGSLIGEDAFQRIGAVCDTKLIMLTGKNWHPGVIGIVASKVSERYHRPTILISEEEDGSCRGSVRTIENFDVYKMLLTCRDLFTDFGGHKDAAGFGIQSDNLAELKRRLSNHVEETLNVEALEPTTKIDLELPSEMITIDYAREIERLEPFGPGNQAPVFLGKNMKFVSAKQVGSDGAHLKVKLTDGNSVFDGIGFGIGKLIKNIEGCRNIDVAFNLTVNEWDGYSFPQMEIIDMRSAQ